MDRRAHPLPAAPLPRRDSPQADETYLWPDALAPAEVADASESEILTVYPHRWAVPRDGWGNLFSAAEQEIGVLVYSGLFLADDTGMHALLTRKASEGVSVRFLLGDPDSPHVETRGQDEGIDEAMAAKIRNVFVLYRELRDIIFYTSDGEARQEFAVLFTARPTGGTPTPSGESREVLWMPRDQILSLNMDRSMRMRVQHYLDACPQPYLG